MVNKIPFSLTNLNESLLPQMQSSAFGWNFQKITLTLAFFRSNEIFQLNGKHPLQIVGVRGVFQRFQQAPPSFLQGSHPTWSLNQQSNCSGLYNEVSVRLTTQLSKLTELRTFSRAYIKDRGLNMKREYKIQRLFLF